MAQRQRLRFPGAGLNDHLLPVVVPGGADFAVGAGAGDLRGVDDHDRVVAVQSHHLDRLQRRDDPD
ncbi:hypothetical protein D9M71_534040 [compost metagenome]